MIRTIGLAAALLVISAAPFRAQQVPTKSLGPREAEFPAQWTNVVGVRELRDGRVVVLDARDQAVKLVDFMSAKSTMIGRKGSGPGEYQLPLKLIALPGDSSAIFDMANSGTPMVVTPNGAAGGVLPGQTGGGFVDNLSEADGRGRIYRTAHSYGPAGLPAIERLDRGTHRVDTVAYISRGPICSADGSPPVTAPPSSARGVERTAARGGRPAPFSTIEQWAVAADGRVAIVCPDPYRAVFIAGEGARVIGPTIPFERIKVTEAEKQAWRDEGQQPVAGIRFTSDGKQTAGYTRGSASPEPETWPEYLPAFLMPHNRLNGAATFAPDGMLWVHRATAADAAPLFDIVGRDGRLAFRMTLPRRTRLVGFGANSVYLVRIDDDDIEYLQRYRLSR